MGAFWFKPNKDNWALWLSLALSSPDTDRNYIFVTNASFPLSEESLAATIISEVFFLSRYDRIFELIINYFLHYI